MSVITLEVVEHLLASDGSGKIIVKLDNLTATLSGHPIVCTKHGNLEFATTTEDVVNYPVGTVLTLS